MRKSAKKLVALALSFAMAITVANVAPNATESDAATTTTTTATTTSGAAVKTYAYHAYLNFQTDYNWLFRSESFGDTAGLKSTSYTYTTSAGKEVKKAFNYSKNYCKAGPGFGKYKEGGVFAANFQDATITKNGTYTVSVSGLNLTAAGMGLTGKTDDDFDNFTMLSVQTDITKKCPGAKFTINSLSFDGKVFASDFNGKVFPKSDSKDSLGNEFYNLMLVNAYGSSKNGDAPSWLSDDLKTKLSSLTSATAAQKTIASKYMPSNSISITFTVSGIDFTKDPSQYLIKKTTTSSSTVGLKKGKKFTKNGIKYKVTTVAKSGKKGKVSVVGVSKKTKKSYTIPATAKYSSKASYTVTSIASNAFKNCKKATKITLGKNVKTISKNAFKNCKKLATLKLSAKLSTIKKGAFTGCKKTIKVSGTSKKTNVKKLKKCGYKKFK